MHLIRQALRPEQAQRQCQLSFDGDELSKRNTGLGILFTTEPSLVLDHVIPKVRGRIGAPSLFVIQAICAQHLRTGLYSVMSFLKKIWRSVYRPVCLQLKFFCLSLKMQSFVLSCVALFRWNRSGRFGRSLVVPPTALVIIHPKGIGSLSILVLAMVRPGFSGLWRF